MNHTPSHINCPACELSRKTMLEPGVLAKLPFPAAADIWFNSHTLQIGPGTVKHYRNCIRALEDFFSELRLNQIHIGHFEQYQRMRLSGDGLPIAGPSCINHELNTLSQILKRAGLWAVLAQNYKPLKLPRPKVGCALEPEEAEHLFRAARSNPRWMVAYCCALISANTTADGSALRFLKLRNVHLDSKTFDIEEGEKNEYRYRSLPLNEPALWAMQELVKRAREMGATAPDHYLLPHRAKNGEKGWDPTRPMFSWRTAWDKLREVAGLPHFRFKDLRHHAITTLLEDENVSERTVIDLAGHVSRAMLDRYSHIRMKTKQDAVDALAKKAAPVGGPRLVLIKS